MHLIRNKEEYDKAYAQSISDPDGFWSDEAESFEWFKKWSQVLSPDMLKAHNKWFVDGKLNITVNAIDRHLHTIGAKPAIIWEPNDPEGESKVITYFELHERVGAFANGLRSLGVKKGDRVCIYMPMIPEIVVAIHACARIGAIHSVVFAGFSATSLSERIKDCEATTVICSGYNFRGPKKISVKQIVDEAIALGGKDVTNVIVYSKPDEDIEWVEGRDKSWEEVTKDQSPFCIPEVMDSEDPLFILYTSGSTGKPKGVVHTTAGYMVYAAYTFRTVFQYQPEDIFFCTADVGWITGHTYLAYGPLLCGATIVMFEGIPTFPDPSRFWRIIEKHKVSIFYTAPTAIRSLMAHGEEYTVGHDLTSLRVLGTVGEPINEDAWNWYHEKIGLGKIPLVDTWWQTETGGIMISPIAGITDNKPCFASYPLPGVNAVLVDKAGNIIEGNDVEGLLCIASPWPSIIRTTYGDHGRCYQNYFSAFPGMYFTGDGARRDEDGRYRIIGRVDDVLNVSGHRIGTAEVENVINEHISIVESAVVGYPHPVKGQGIFAFVIPLSDSLTDDVLIKEINELLTNKIGAIAKADKMIIVSGLPKTRSGKIMRRILRKVAEGELDSIGDTSTLLNPEIVEEIIRKATLA